MSLTAKKFNFARLDLMKLLFSFMFSLLILQPVIGCEKRSEKLDGDPLTTFIQRAKSSPTEKKACLGAIEELKLAKTEQRKKALHTRQFWSFVTLAGLTGTYFLWKYRFPKKVFYSVGGLSFFAGLLAAKSEFSYREANVSIKYLESTKEKIEKVTFDSKH
jgi:hypothetical protein